MPFKQLINQFKLVRLEFHLQLGQDSYIPNDAGSVMHGVFGHAWLQWCKKQFQQEQNDAKAIKFLQLYNAYFDQPFLGFGQQGNSDRKPYSLAIKPQKSSFSKTYKRGYQWQKGEIFCFELRLYGDACYQAEDICHAIKDYVFHQSQKEPLKNYRIIAAKSLCGKQAYASNKSFTLAQHIKAMHNDLATKDIIYIQLLSRLKLVIHKQKLQNAPDLPDLYHQIKIRLLDLTREFHDEDHHRLNQIRQQLTLQINSDNQSKVINIPHQGKKLVLDGLTGQLIYRNIIADNTDLLLSILAIGELIQVGKKTSFGLGFYQLKSF